MKARLQALASATQRLAADWDFRIAVLIGIATTAVLALTADQGFVRDEGYYFRAAAEYHRWFEDLWRNLLAGQPLDSFTDPVLRQAFGYNTEHPGFAKIAMGWSHKLFTVWLGVTTHATGFRLAAILMVATGNAFLYLFGAHLSSRPVGVLGALLLLVCPHVFYHSHLACFDGPIMGLTVVVVYAFWRSLESRAWVLGVGLAWGVAVATKHNAIFLLPTLLVAYAGARAARFRLPSRGELALPGLPVGIISMLLLAPVIFFIFYPYGWHDPIVRIGEYYGYHLHHEHYPVEYFGTLYTTPPFPWHFPFVMSALTIPVPILIPGCVGVGVVGFRLWGSLRRARSGVETDDQLLWWLVLTNLLVPPVIIALPTVPIFGGTKHWLTMMPFFCLLAGWVIWGAACHLAGRLHRGRLVAATASIALPLGLALFETGRTHPLGQTYFNELALGHQGAAALGMVRTFWGGDGRDLLPALNQEAAPGAAVFTDRMNQDDFQAYKKDGLLRRDLRWVLDIRQADWALINHQREFQAYEFEIWSLNGHRRPAAVLDFDGVPIASLYRVEQPR